MTGEVVSGTKVTAQYLAGTRSYFYENAPDRINTTENTVTAAMMKHAEKKYHGGYNSYYPFVDTAHTLTYITAMGTGALAADTPADTDYMGAGHQYGWGFWGASVAISHQTLAMCCGGWTAKEKVIDLAKQKQDTLMNLIGDIYEKNIILGDGTSETILGFAKVFDITNSSYLGTDMTAGSAFLAPKNVTIATNQNSLTYADMIGITVEMTEGSQKPDLCVMNKDAYKRLLVIGENTVERTQGGKIEIGASSISSLGTEIVLSDNIPTTTSTKIYFLNFGNAIKTGLPGAKQSNQGSYWLLEFAGPDPLGFEVTDWVHRYDYDAVAVEMLAAGAFKMACLKTEAQGYISIT